MKYFPLFIALLFALLASCRGQNPNKQLEDSIIQIQSESLDNNSSITHFNIINTPNAPTRITRKVKLDKEGNLLMASYDDIVRYDGKSFFHFPKEDGLETWYAFDVMEDSSGNMWIVSDQVGVYLHDRESLTHFTTKDGLGHRRNMCIYEDRAGNIWIGGQGGVSRYDGKTFQIYSTKDGLTHNDVSCIMEDSKGNMWFGTRGTACVYDGKTFTEIKDDEGNPFINVWDFIEDRHGNIWHNGGGIWRYDGTSFTQLSTEGAICLYEDKKGNIWTSPSGTLSYYDEKTLLDEKSSLIPIFSAKGAIALLGIIEDNDGNIWVGSGDGVWRYDGKAITYFTGKQAEK